MDRGGSLETAYIETTTKDIGKGTLENPVKGIRGRPTFGMST